MSTLSKTNRPMIDHLPAFAQALNDQDRAELTIAGYQADVRLFARWFEQSNDEVCTFKSVTPTDVREYRQYLLNTAGRKASTINRKLAAFTAFMQFA